MQWFGQHLDLEVQWLGNNKKNAEVLRPNKTQRHGRLENMEVQWTGKTWRYVKPVKHRVTVAW